ncbi:MAG: 30S ribosomal protein S17 [Alphaproteobacteria bacterium]|nr:30S ribosomal protein S17 [Alphaproteobacteria bacterium]
MPRRILEGQVVSDKMDKTITVLVQRRYIHPVYKKYVMRTDKYAAHDGENHFKVGDKVSIIECAPISRRKRWTVVTGAETSSAAPEKKAAPVAAKKAEKAPDTKKAPAKAAAKKTTAKKKDA